MQYYACRNTREQVSLGQTSSVAKSSPVTIRHDDRLLAVKHMQRTGIGQRIYYRKPDALCGRALHRRPLGWRFDSTPGLRTAKHVAPGATRTLYHSLHVVAIHFPERVTNGPFDGVPRLLANRNLFNLPREEIDSVREEASRLLGADWSRSELSSPLSTPPTRDQHATDRACDNRVWGVPKPATEASAGKNWATLKCWAVPVACKHCPRCEARSVSRRVKSLRRAQVNE